MNGVAVGQVLTQQVVSRGTAKPERVSKKKCEAVVVFSKSYQNGPFSLDSEAIHTPPWRMNRKSDDRRRV